VLLLIISLFSSCNDKSLKNNNPLINGSPVAQGFSTEGLDQIDHLFGEYIDRHEIAGAIAVIARRGKIIYYKATGYSDLEHQVPLKKDAIFRIASQTKAITSVAVMMLYEEGRIGLNDPISKYLPEFSNPCLVADFNKRDSTYTTRPVSREVTIHDLLTHTSGYCYPGGGSDTINAIYAKDQIVGAIPSKNLILKSEMQKISEVPLEFEPGKRFCYGLSTDILGYLVEELSGQTLSDFFSSRIFKPLGMNDTYSLIPLKKQERLMILYKSGPDGNGIVKDTSVMADYPKAEGTYCSGGGGLSSTAMDYAIFMQMLLNEGSYNGIRILKPETVRMMTRNHIGKRGAGSLFIRSTDKFGLGFEVILPPNTEDSPISNGSYGWGGAFGSLYWIDPCNEFIVQLVIQKEGEYTGLRSNFIDAIYNAFKKSVKNQGQE